jgi:hypothetical protein
VAIGRKTRSHWPALMPNAHEGYVSWDNCGVALEEHASETDLTSRTISGWR